MQLEAALPWQAKSSWNWCSGIATFAAEQGEGRIFLNLDESFIPYYLTGKAGFLVKRSKAERDLQPPLCENIGV